MVEVVAYNPAVRRDSYLKARDRNLAYSAEYNLKRKFNLTQADYNTMLERQLGVCAICKQQCSRKLAVDHDHQTKKVRGLLCNKCNRGLGYFQDSEEILRKAATYLEESRRNN